MDSVCADIPKCHTIDLPAGAELQEVRRVDGRWQVVYSFPVVGEETGENVACLVEEENDTIHLDDRRHTATVNGSTIRFTPQQYRILAFLVEHEQVDLDDFWSAFWDHAKEPIRSTYTCPITAINAKLAGAGASVTISAAGGFVRLVPVEDEEEVPR